MQTKFHMPEDVKRSAIALVMGYKRRLEQYNDLRWEIINSSPTKYTTYTAKKKKGGEEQRRQYWGANSILGDPTATKVQKLAALEKSRETLRMRAVEQAKFRIGVDIADERIRRRLRDAIWDSCVEGRNFTFEYRNLPMGKTNFYHRRAEFLSQIARDTEYL